MIEFTENQKRTITTGLTALSLAAVFAFASLVVWILFKALSLASAALVPVLVGLFLALFFRPYYLWLKGLVRNPTVALLLLLFTVLVPILLLLWYAGSVLVDQVSNLVAQGPQLLGQVSTWFQTTFPKLHALLVQVGVTKEGGLEAVYVKYGATALKAGTGAVKCLSGLVTLFVTSIFFVIFLMSPERRGSDLAAHLPFLKDDTKVFFAAQVDAFTDILVSFFQRQTVICLIEACLYGTGFALVGLPYGFLIGFTLGVFNLVPFFGSVACLPLALPLAYFGHGGSLSRLLLVLGVWLTGQALDGYLITPKIQGDKTGLGYAGVIFSFFFWATVLGPLLGMLLAIPLSAFCVVLWRALKVKYIKPVV